MLRFNSNRRKKHYDHDMKSLIDRYGLDDDQHCFDHDHSSSPCFSNFPEPLSESSFSPSSLTASTVTDDDDYLEEEHSKDINDDNRRRKNEKRLSRLDISIHSGTPAYVQYANPTQVQSDCLMPSINLREYVKTEIFGPANKTLRKDRPARISRSRTTDFNNQTEKKIKQKRSKSFDLITSRFSLARANGLRRVITEENAPREESITPTTQQQRKSQSKIRCQRKRIRNEPKLYY